MRSPVAEAVVGAACEAYFKKRAHPVFTPPPPDDHLELQLVATVRLLTFGGLAVRTEQGPAAGATAQPRRLAVLALVGRNGERGITRGKLLALLWPDADEERGRRVLSQALYALRRDLGNVEAIEGTQDLRLNARAVWCDVVHFEAALARGDADQATALYAGPFLDGFRLPSAPEFERWVEEERVALQHRYHEALEHLARAAESEGAYALAVKWWRRRAADDPLNARVAVAMMRALTAAGDRNGALRLARMFEALIAQELELPPDREVVELADALRRDPDHAAAGTRRKDERPCIAVLPFVTIGDADDATRAAWCDGLAEEIIHALAAEPSLRVAARSASTNFGPTPALADLQTALGASLVLEGSLRFHGDAVRITIRLIEIAGSHTLWSERMDRATGDLHAVHDDVAARIADSVRTAVPSLNA